LIGTDSEIVVAYFTAPDLYNPTRLGGFLGRKRGKLSKGVRYKIIGYEIIRDDMEWDFNSIAQR
jgi:hypothetical protein